MMYERIISYVMHTPWAILPDKLEAITGLLADRAAGRIFSADDIRARIGGDPQPQPAASKRGAVAVIPLRGVIAHRMGTLEESSGGMSAERFTKMVQQATADESIGTIVLDVDSPGGTVAGLGEAADAVYAARDTKRVIAVANATCASAAYWIASQAHEIVAIPSALDRSIGSIGVFTVHQDMSAALEKEGVKVTLIKAGKHKAEANPFEPLSDDLKAEIQASVDQAYAAFVKAVARGRGVATSDVKGGYGEGKALSAKDALAAGLVDRIATMDDVIGGLIGRTSRAGMRAEDEDVALVAEDPSVMPLTGAQIPDVDLAQEADRLRRLERF